MSQYQHEQDSTNGFGPRYPDSFNPESIPVISQTFLQCLIVAKTLSYSRAAQIYSKIIITYLRKACNASTSDIPDPHYPGEPLTTDVFPELDLPHHIRAPCSAPDNEKTYLPRLLESLDTKIASLDLSVKTLRDQLSGIRVICCVNLHMSAGTAMATGLSAAEVEWLKTLLDSMFGEVASRHDIFAVKGSQLHAAYPTSALNRDIITRDIAIQKALKMIDYGWFIEVQYDQEMISPFVQDLQDDSLSKNKKSKTRKNKSQSQNGGENDDDDDEFDDSDTDDNDSRTQHNHTLVDRYFTLSTRGLAELERYIKDKFGKNSNTGPDGQGTIKHCVACKKLWTLGYRCLGTAPDGHPCDIHMHHYCRQRLANMNTLNCPGCKQNLDNYIPIGL